MDNSPKKIRKAVLIVKDGKEEMVQEGSPEHIEYKNQPKQSERPYKDSGIKNSNLFKKLMRTKLKQYKARKDYGK